MTEAAYHRIADLRSVSEESLESARLGLLGCRGPQELAACGRQLLHGGQEAQKRKRQDSEDFLPIAAIPSPHRIVTPTFWVGFSSSVHPLWKNTQGRTWMYFINFLGVSKYSRVDIEG